MVRVAMGRETQPLTMGVTPRIIIQEEEEEKMGMPAFDDPFAENDTSRPVERSLGTASLGTSFGEAATIGRAATGSAPGRKTGRPGLPAVTKASGLPDGRFGFAYASAWAK